MLSFRGFQWIYDVTKADETTQARAASFVCRLHQAERALSVAVTGRTPSSRFRVAALGNSSASLRPGAVRLTPCPQGFERSQQ